MKKIQQRTGNLIYKFQGKMNEDNHSAFTLNYESSVYRQKDLVGLIRDTIPFFALTHEEYQEYIKNNEISEINRQSFNRVSTAHANKKGDYGEILLYLVLKIFYKSEKFVTKVRLRTSKTDQIKGYDCAHFTIENNEPILWLGEAKFYTDIAGAIRESFKSIIAHLDTQYLRDEIDLLKSNIEINNDYPDEYFQLLKDYITGGKSLDDISIRIPILLTYESKDIAKFCSHEDSDFIEFYQQEFIRIFGLLSKKSWPKRKNISFEFILFPFNSISELKADLAIMEGGFRF